MFQTATGKPISVSAEALRRAEARYLQEHEGASSSSGMTITPVAAAPSGPRDNGRPSLPSSRLHQAGESASVNPAEQTDADAASVPLPLVTTGSGTPVKVSQAALTRAEERLSQLTSSEPTIFVTASGRPLQVSQDSLVRAERKLTISAASGPMAQVGERERAAAAPANPTTEAEGCADFAISISSTSFSSQSQVLFSTASGRPIVPSQDAIARAEARLLLSAMDPVDAADVAAAAAAHVAGNNGDATGAAAPTATPPLPLRDAVQRAVEATESNARSPRTPAITDRIGNDSSESGTGICLFATGSGRAIQVGEAALARARAKMAAATDAEDTAASASTSRTDSAQPPAKSAEPVASLFATGSGRSIQVGEAALARARAKMAAAAAEDDDDHRPALAAGAAASAAPPTAAAPVASLFATGSGRAIRVNDAALARARAKLNLDDEDASSADASAATSTSLKRATSGDGTSSLFGMASGKGVRVSEAAVAQAQAKFGGTDGDAAPPARTMATQQQNKTLEFQAPLVPTQRQLGNTARIQQGAASGGTATTAFGIGVRRQKPFVTPRSVTLPASSAPLPASLSRTTQPHGAFTHTQTPILCTTPSTIIKGSGSTHHGTKSALLLKIAMSFSGLAEARALQPQFLEQLQTRVVAAFPQRSGVGIRGSVVDGSVAARTRNASAAAASSSQPDVEPLAIAVRASFPTAFAFDTTVKASPADVFCADLFRLNDGASGGTALVDVTAVHRALALLIDAAATSPPAAAAAKKFASLAWVRHHYALTVWALLDASSALPAIDFSSLFDAETIDNATGDVALPLFMRRLHPVTILLHLAARLNTEYGLGRRSFYRTVVERDAVPTVTHVCIVCGELGARHPKDSVWFEATDAAAAGLAGGRPAAPATMTLLVTDGWYILPAQLDPALVQVARAGGLAVGTRLAVWGASLGGPAGSGADGCGPLELDAGTLLMLSYNGVRPARTSSALGTPHDSLASTASSTSNATSAASSSTVPVRNLKEIHASGGTVPSIRCVVQRVLGDIFIERQPAAAATGTNQGTQGRTVSVVRNGLSNAARDTQFQRQRERRAELLSGRADAAGDDDDGGAMQGQLEAEGLWARDNARLFSFLVQDAAAAFDDTTAIPSGITLEDDALGPAHAFLAPVAAASENGPRAAVIQVWCRGGSGGDEAQFAGIEEGAVLRIFALQPSRYERARPPFQMHLLLLPKQSQRLFFAVECPAGGISKAAPAVERWPALASLERGADPMVVLAALQSTAPTATAPRRALTAGEAAEVPRGTVVDTVGVLIHADPAPSASTTSGTVRWWFCGEGADGGPLLMCLEAPAPAAAAAARPSTATADGSGGAAPASFQRTKETALPYGEAQPGRLCVLMDVMYDRVSTEGASDVVVFAQSEFSQLRFVPAATTTQIARAWSSSVVATADATAGSDAEPSSSTLRPEAAADFAIQTLLRPANSPLTTARQQRLFLQALVRLSFWAAAVLPGGIATAVEEFRAAFVDGESQRVLADTLLPEHPGATIAHDGGTSTSRWGGDGAAAVVEGCIEGSGGAPAMAAGGGPGEVSRARRTAFTPTTHPVDSARPLIAPFPHEMDPQTVAAAGRSGLAPRGSLAASIASTAQAHAAVGTAMNPHFNASASPSTASTPAVPRRSAFTGCSPLATAPPQGFGVAVEPTTTGPALVATHPAVAAGIKVLAPSPAAPYFCVASFTSVTLTGSGDNLGGDAIELAGTAVLHNGTAHAFAHCRVPLHHGLLTSLFARAGLASTRSAPHTPTVKTEGAARAVGRMTGVLAPASPSVFVLALERLSLIHAASEAPELHSLRCATLRCVLRSRNDSPLSTFSPDDDPSAGSATQAGVALALHSDNDSANATTRELWGLLLHRRIVLTSDEADEMSQLMRRENAIAARLAAATATSGSLDSTVMEESLLAEGTQSQQPLMGRGAGVGGIVGSHRPMGYGAHPSIIAMTPDSQQQHEEHFNAAVVAEVQAEGAAVAAQLAALRARLIAQYHPSRGQQQQPAVEATPFLFWTEAAWMGLWTALCHPVCGQLFFAGFAPSIGATEAAANGTAERSCDLTAVLASPTMLTRCVPISGSSLPVSALTAE